MPIGYEIKKSHEKRRDESGYPTVVSFYTVGTLYEDEVVHLLNSLDKFDLPYKVFGIEASSVEWVEVCQLKPHIIKMAMESEPGRDVVWLDADSSVVRPPEFLKTAAASFAAYGFQKQPGRFMSGTVLFKSGYKSLEILQEWIDLQETDTHRGKTWDQDVMSLVFMRHRGSVGRLPKEYLKKYDKLGKRTPVVVHWMASREYYRNMDRKIETRRTDDL